MAYLDYVGLAYFKSLLDENYLRTDYSGDTTIQGNVTFTEPVDADVKNDYLGNQIDKTYIKNLRPEDDGEVALIYGDDHEEVITIDTAVTQVRSDANEMYPILLCYDANAEVNQISKSVRYGHNVAINPAYGYVYANSYVVKHPTYNRTISATTRVEWASDFRDSVLNPVGQVFEYIDPVSSGGEHRMEFRLYGNPNVVGINTPNVNDETNTISMGVSATRGDSLTFFGYCPSTPIYLEDSSTMRKSLTRGDQYGRDIITRDWLNLNGSITGLVHTYMDEAIDGSKTFKKTVTINSGNNSNKADLYVQGNSDIHGNEHVYGTETVDGKLTANDTAEIKGGSGNNPSLLVTGNETVTGKLTGTGTAEFSGGSGNTPTLTVNGNESVSGNSSVGGNSSITGNETVGGNISTTNGNISTTNGTISGNTGSIGSGGLTVAGNETVSGKIIGNGGAEISGGSGLKVNGDEIVTGNITTNGNIIKIVDNTPIEYVTYITNQPATREVISQNLLSIGKGLAKDSQGKIYVDFSQIDEDTKAEILNGLDTQVPLAANKTLRVNGSTGSDSIPTTMKVSERINTKFKTIQACVNWATKTFALNNHSITILIDAGVYDENVILPEMNTTTGRIILASSSGSNDVTIQKSVSSGGAGYVVNAKGGIWQLSNITISHKVGTGLSSSYTGACLVSDDNAIVHVYGCSFVTSGSNNSGGSVRMICADNGGKIQIHPGYSGGTISANTNHVSNVYVLAALRTGTISLWRTYESLTERTYNCSGACSVFAFCANGGSINSFGVGDPINFTGSITGKHYQIQTGSFCNTGSGDANFFPGGGTNSEGTVQANTYCWYY